MSGKIQWTCIRQGCSKEVVRDRPYYYEHSLADPVAPKGVVGQRILPEPGRKDDADKNQLDLLQFKAIELVGEIATFGAKKYAPDNWRLVKNWRRRYLGALLRHTFAWARGEQNDPETGKHHLAHAAWNVLSLLELDHEQIKE